MAISRQLTNGLGMLVAPWFFLAGRAFRSKRFAQWALAADPQYLRAAQLSGRPGHSRQAVLQFRTAALLALEASPAAAGQIKELLADSESQLLQDIFCALSLDEKREGFFVEVGVGSGQAISNTYLLEKHFGWSGVLVEPNRSFHDSIAAVRTARLDRRAAASESGTILKFQELLDLGEFSRVAGTGGHDLDGERTLEYDVATVSLNELLDEMGAPEEIDFLSLDTEGSELDILAGLDLDRFRFKVMVIEHNFDRTVRNELQTMLAARGYRLVFEHISSFDAWFVHNSVQSANFDFERDRGRA